MAYLLCINSIIYDNDYINVGTISVNADIPVGGGAIRLWNCVFKKDSPRSGGANGDKEVIRPHPDGNM